MKFHIVPVTPYMQNCSILVCPDTHEAAFVDPGGDVDVLVAKVVSLGVTPTKIFLTHGHMDHISGAKALSEHYSIPIEGAHEDEKMLFESLPIWCQNVGFPHVDSFLPDRWLTQGDVIEFGNQTLDVYFCPGHTPGHVVFVHQGIKTAWVGDVLFQGSIGRTDFPGGDHQTLISSITQTLWPLGDDIQFVPGHGPMSSFGQERRTNPFVSDTVFG
ncbi:MAG: MBL fold metallo-hydrolase [Pseudomonadota bacterium]